MALGLEAASCRKASDPPPMGRDLMEVLALIPVSQMFREHGIAKSAGYQAIANGLLPRPLPHGGRLSRVPRHESTAVLAAKLRGDTTEEIRALVAELHAARSQGLAAADAVVRAAIGPKAASRRVKS